MNRALPEHLQIDSDIDARLHNWALVMRDRPARGITATGVICDRLARTAGVFDSLAEQPAVQDEADALLIERAWRSPDMPMYFRSLLKAAYLMNLPPWKTCKVLAIHKAAYDAELKKATVIIDNIAGRIARRIERAVNP